MTADSVMSTGYGEEKHMTPYALHRTGVLAFPL